MKRLADEPKAKLYWCAGGNGEVVITVKNNVDDAKEEYSETYGYPPTNVNTVEMLDGYHIRLEK